MPVDSNVSSSSSPHFDLITAWCVSLHILQNQYVAFGLEDKLAHSRCCHCKHLSQHMLWPSKECWHVVHLQFGFLLRLATISSTFFQASSSQYRLTIGRSTLSSRTAFDSELLYTSMSLTLIFSLSLTTSDARCSPTNHERIIFFLSKYAFCRTPEASSRLSSFAGTLWQSGLFLLVFLSSRILVAFLCSTSICYL